MKKVSMLQRKNLTVTLVPSHVKIAVISVLGRSTPTKPVPVPTKPTPGEPFFP